MSGWNLQSGKSILFGDFVIGADYSNDNPAIAILMSYFRQLTQRRADAYRRYQSGIRDTATPEGMTKLLVALVEGRLLSSESTKFLLRAMRDTTTFPDRLKAGLRPGWALAHKTGTSGSWAGVTAASNDAGILFDPNGERVAITVFIGDSSAPPADRAKVMARIAAAAIP